jgi:predicted  nucleic acid-binding Zn-ribbon protein
MKKLVVRIIETSSKVKDHIYDKVDKTAEKDYAKKDRAEIEKLTKQKNTAKETLRNAKKNKSATTSYYEAMEKKIQDLETKIAKIREKADLHRNN